MPDYDLRGLSPRSFEQLIQAIALRVVSPKTIIFGDGTDGGREATFKGKTNYNNDEPWDGYIVFQAKFCQHPTNDTAKDGAWAIAQLKKELEDFANPDKKRTKPEYYIFVTNVTLTPVSEKGSKDKAYQVFDDYQGKVPIKDYDIWDYDKICRFIDDNADIRKAYAAWITPGDVLSQVVELLSFDKPDFQTVIYTFLKKELLSDLYANLEQAGHSREDKIPLASVFVDLPVAGIHINKATVTGEDSNIVASLLESAQQKFDRDSLNVNSIEKSFLLGMPLLHKTSTLGRWVVIGGPGQGKTTVGQFLCQLFRVAIIKDKTDIANLEIQQALSNFASQCKQENICFPKARRFPLRIVLNEFAAVLASNDAINSVLDYVVLLIRKRTSRTIDVEDIRQWLANYPWLIVLDGLDEVPASSNRDRVLSAIQDFNVDVDELNADVMIVATTRPQGYNQDFGTDYYNHVHLSPLSKEQALHYARRVLKLRYSNDSERQLKIISRLERAVKDDFTSRLMQSPLQVTIMTVLLNKTGQAPKDRWSLFNKYYDIIYDREVEREIPASDILRDYKADIDSIHYQVGLLLQVQSESSGKTDARLSVDNFTTLVRSRLEEEGHEGKECEALIKQIIEAAANRLVFLVGLEQDLVGFEVRSLQEFMASEAIMNGSDEQVRNRLEEIIPIISWRNVVLFAIGKCFARNEKEHLRESIHTKCSALNDLDQLNYACLSGSRLALDILEDGSVTHKPKYLKLFTRLALRLLDIPPDNFHIQLANVCTESIHSIYSEAIESRIISQNSHQSFGAWTCLLQLINLDLGWAINLGEQYWFDDLDKQLRIICCFLKLNLSIFDQQRWIAKKLEYILPKISPVIANQYLPLFKDTLFDLKTNYCTYQFISAFESQRSDDFFLDIQHNHDVFPSFSNNKFINNVWTLYYIPSIVIACEFEERDVFLFSIEFIGQLESIEDINYYWIAYKYAIYFWFNPSTELLSKVLKYVADHYDEELIYWIIKLVPWQIYECLLAAEDAQELIELSEIVKTGKLGSPEDWKKAEERWDKFGISAEDFLYVPVDELPFDSNIANQGFPLNNNDWTIYFRGKDNEINIQDLKHLFADLINLLASLTDKNAIRVISSLLVYLLDEDDVKQEIVPQNNNQEYAVLKQGIQNSIVLPNFASQEIIESIFSVYKLNSDFELLELLDIIGHQKKFKHYISLGRYKGQPEIYKEMLNCFEENHQLTGILNILSYMYPEQRAMSILSTINCKLVNPGNFTEYKYKEAAVIVGLARKNWSDKKIDEVVNYGIDMSDQYPRVIPRIITMMEYYNLFSLSVSDKFLKQLSHRLPKSEWEYLSHVDKLINEQLAGKTSNLIKQDSWNRLGLPSGTK